MNNLVIKLIDKEIEFYNQLIYIYEDERPAELINEWKCKREYFKSCKQILEGSMDADALNYDAFVGMGCCEEE